MTIIRHKIPGKLQQAASFHGPDTPVKVLRAFVKHNVPQASGDLLYHMHDGDPDEVLAYLKSDPGMADICHHDWVLFGAPRRSEWRYPKGHESYTEWASR